MKKVIKTIGISSLLLMYIMVVNYYGSNLISANSASMDKQMSYNNNYLSNSSLFLIPQIQIENIVQAANNIPTPVRKTHHFNAYIRLLPFELNLVDPYSKSNFYITHTIIQFQKIDIVYPFHFFL